ncbi:MAG: hypothetical protein FIB01_13935 [Gemmatimonadetes bacterium]|nr:hypothetical protein [Gemmatimonadota bacterium]
MNARRAGLALAVAVCLGLTLSGDSPLSAQTVPFGKNKIQYHDFAWRVLSGPHLDVYYYPEEEEVARLALSWGEESYAFLERKFQHHPFRRIPLIVYASDQHFEQTNVFPGFIPEGVLGFTEYLKRRVSLPFRGDYAQFRGTLRHELVHAFQLSKLSEVAQQNPRGRGESPQRIHWWTEGLAEFWSGEQTVEDDMFVRDLVVNARLPDIKQFSRTYSFFSYPVGAELHKYLSQRFGDDYIVRLYETYWQYDSFDAALAGVLGEDLDRLSREWRYSLERRHLPQYAARPPLDVGAGPVVMRGGANYHPVAFVAPGDTTLQLLFLSPRNGYTNLYRISLARGESHLGTVLRGERSAEFESFHASESGFDVNQHGVVAITSKFLERDALLLWDVTQRRVVGRYQWPDLVGLRSPSWDAAGERVVFEGLSNSGFSDLYLLDFRTQQLRRLTSDRYRDANPDWAPDGDRIVFASDRTAYGADGASNLFLLGLADGSIDYLTCGPWHDQQPRWSPDGRGIAFSSDRAGTYDLYLVEPNGNGRRLSYLTGGAYDPEWLPGSDALVFGGFQQISFRIFRMTLPPDTVGAGRIALDVPARAWQPADAALAGADSAPARLVSWHWAEATGADAAQAASKPYQTLRKVSLDFAAADALVAPGYGSAQGVQFLASDLLGDHILFTSISAAQVSRLSDFRNSFSGGLLYLNMKRRLNWGAGLFRFQGRFRDVLFDIYDEDAYGAQFIASYPFSRFRRVELQLAVQRSDRLDIEDAWDDGIFGGGGDSIPSRDLTRRGTLSSSFVSYVKDNTLWLPTGPIDGERYNISLGMSACFACDVPSTVTGALVHRSATAENFVFLADYRRYFRTSLQSAYAIRAYAYFSDGALPGRSALGGSNRLRGYPYLSLAGSRAWLLNQEWRFPILDGIALAFPFGTLRLPGIQGAVFADAGSSWIKQRSMHGVWGGYGLGFRTSLGAPLVLRLDVGRRYAWNGKPPVVLSRGEGFNDTFVDFWFGFNF